MTYISPTPSPVASVLAQISSIANIGSRLNSAGPSTNFSTLLTDALNSVTTQTSAQPGPSGPSGPVSAPTGSGWAFEFASTPNVPGTQAPFLPNSPNGSPNFGSAVAADASKYLGAQYQWGGTSPSTGFDCSGLVQHVFGDLGVTLPRVAASQQNMGTPVPALAQAQPGDLLFYGQPAYHVGIYIGNNQMIAAPEQGQVVQVDPVGTPTSITRIVPSTSTSASLAQQAGQYLPIFEQAANANNLNVNLLLSVAKVESNFNPNAVSSAGAQGIMQIMPTTASGLGINPLDPNQAIPGAAKLLAEKLSAFGTPALAAAAYNAGDNAVRQYGGIPPYSQTQNYVAAVMSNMNGVLS